jgi:ribosome-binding protein aMBF1 (putative translation factor)
MPSPRKELKTMETITTEPPLGLARRNASSTPEERLQFARGHISQRCRAGLSVTALARKSGVTAQHLYRLESGLSMPTAETILKLAKAIGCAPGAFFKVDRRKRENRVPR